MVVRRTGYPQVDPRATGLMDRHIIAVPARTTVGDAARLARHRRARLVAVRLRAGWTGATSATLADALRLGLADVPIEVLLWDVAVVAPGTSEIEVRRQLGPARPFVLVRGPRGPEGAIFVEPGGSSAPLPLSAGTRLDRLPPASVDLLRHAGRLGDALGMPVAAVGGLVRDLLLGRLGRRPDIDLVVEGDARTLARRLAETRGGRLLEHAAFRTATLELPDGRRLDLASARRERYHAPGALPAIEPASLTEDLGRRDFSLNALALRLTPAAWGMLVDPTGGLADLRARRLRVLHGLSFVEDPTRIFRAARLAARLACRIDPGTRRLAMAAAGLDRYAALSGDRLRGEVELLLAEPRPAAAVAAAARLGAWRLLGTGPGVGRAAVRGGAAALALARRACLAPDARIAVLLLALARGGVAAERWAARLALPPAVRDAIHRARTEGSSLRARLGRVRDPARAYAILRGKADVSTAWARLLARDAVARGHLEAHLRHWRQLRPLVTGGDLVGLGVAPGPAVGALLRGLLAAQAAGRVRTRRSALRWLRDAVARGSDASLTRPGKGGG
jgi:tRNA nucleotidyltransferase (CCA-adding enzyme)